MKKLLIVLFATALSGTAFAQNFAIKNNLLYDAGLTPNLGFEMRLGKAASIDISGNWKWFRIKDDISTQHWLVQPELRLWTCETFNGFFFGLHALGGELSFTGFDMPFGMRPADLKSYRYESWYFGGGIVAGYQWILGKHWSLEAVIGAGYARHHWDKYMCGECGIRVDGGKYNYWGPTKASIGIIFFW